MTRELQQLINRAQIYGNVDYPEQEEFGPYARAYIYTNENLRGYMEYLYGKDVLAVSASGDHLLNAVGRGAKRVDTFDINRFSPLIENLKIYAIKYLDRYEARLFLGTFSEELYFKFNDKLPARERMFFDYLYMNYTESERYKILFYSQEAVLPDQVNNYFDISTLDYIKRRIDSVTMNHYSASLYTLTKYLKIKYDVIFLSNISTYLTDIDKFIRFINYLAENHLKENGEIYYAYLWKRFLCESNGKCLTDIERSIRSINGRFNKQFTIERYPEFAEHSHLKMIGDASYYSREGNSVLVYKK